MAFYSASTTKNHITFEKCLHCFLPAEERAIFTNFRFLLLTSRPNSLQGMDATCTHYHNHG
ncbi:hypothetical protein LINPERPRIM_LOCUS24073 [Linum perenne]